MPRILPPLNALRAFEAAGRHQSFTRAADELGVSHSAISKHVRGLEDRLGAQLFRDASRGVALTKAGAAYLAQVSPAFDAISEATEEFSAKPAGTVSVNAETVFAIKWLVPNLNAFYANYPEIRLELDASAELADIARYEADIAIRFYQSGAPDNNSVLLSAAKIYPYAAPEIAVEIGDDPEKLLNYELMRDRARDPWEDWFTLIGRSDLYRVRAPMRRMGAMLTIEAVIAGQGVFLASADNIEQDKKMGRLVKCFETGLQQGSYHMLFGEGVLRRKPVRLFRDWLLSETRHFRDAPAGEG